MKIIRKPEEIQHLDDVDLAAFITLRFAEISPDEPFDPDIYGYFLLAEPGDSFAEIEAAMGCSVLSDDTTWFEYVAEFPHWFEMVFVLCDSGSGIVLLIPKLEGIDRDLMQICIQFAEPSSSDA